MGTSATKLWGNHTLKVGGDFRISRHMLDQVTHPRGEFEYRPGTTASTALAIGLKIPSDILLQADEVIK